MDATVLLVLNAHHDVVKFKLPEVVGGQTWRCLLDTNVPDRTETPRFMSGDGIRGHRPLAAGVRAAAGQRPVDRADPRTRGAAAGGRDARPSDARRRTCRMRLSDPPKPPGDPPRQPDPDDPVPIEDPPPPIPIPPDPPPEPLRAAVRVTRA